jgi:hypothetical protein
MTRWTGIFLVALAALSGCGSDGAVAPADGRMRAVNLVSTRAQVSFLRVERSEASLAYKQSSGLIRANEDTYTFNIEITLPGDIDPTRVFTTTQSITADRDTTFVIAEPTPGNFAVTVLERAPDAPAGQTDIDLLHFANALGSADIYIEPAGTLLTGATAFAAANAFDSVTVGQRPPGDYEISVTAPGNSGIVLFTSATITLPDADRLLLVLADGAGTLTTDVSVLLLSSQGTGDQELVDVNAQSELRVINTAVPLAGLDVIIDDDFVTPLHAAVLPESVTSYAVLAAGDRNLKVTAAGTTATIELDETFGVPAARRSTVLLGGDLGSLSGAQGLDDLQQIAGAAKLRIYSGAVLEGSVNVYIVPPGTGIADEIPVAVNQPFGIGDYLQFLPADYELVFGESGTTNEIGTRLPITLNGGQLYGVLVLDDAIARVRGLLFDDSGT